jgi:hypothetical protein
MQGRSVEACIYGSNPRVTEEVINEVQGSRGVAYSAGFDS